MLFCPVVENFLYFFIPLVCEKNGFGMGAADVKMLCSVIFLFRQCQLMFFNNVVLVIIYGECSYKTGLCTSPKAELIDVVTAFFFSDKNAPV